MAATARKAKTVTRCERHFFYEGRKRTVDITTSITDDEAIDALGGFLAGGFNGDAAIAIGQAAIGKEVKPWLIPWGMKKAHDILNAHPETRLAAKFLKMKAPSKKLDEANGCPFKIARHGSRSKYSGMFTITDQGDWPKNEFYGRAESDGTWAPPACTPQDVIDALTGK